MTKWDAFLSYAHEDKSTLVGPLAGRLRREGMSVWFDDFEIKFGDSISQSIERGLANSHVGIIVISRASLEKNWTNYEISALKNLYINYQRRLIPVWWDVDADSIKNSHPGLLDLRAIVCKDRSVEEVAYDVIAVTRPDILRNVNSKLRKKALDASSPVIEIDPRFIVPGPRRREKFSGQHLSRMRLLHSVFEDVFQDKVEDWIDNFCRDEDFEGELLFWELVAAFYLSWTRQHRYTRSDKKMILTVLLELTQRCSSEQLDKLLDKTPEHVRRPFRNKLNEWNDTLQTVQSYLSLELENHPSIRALFTRL